MTTNPRNRDMVRATPFATTAAALPVIPPGKTEFERAVKGLLDVRGGANNPHERWATMRELAELGLTPGLAETTTPRDVLSIPIWVSRGRFVPVSMTALATSLQGLLTLTDAANTDTIQTLKRQIARIQPGVSPTHLDSAINTAIATLHTQLRNEIVAAADTSALDERLTAIENRVTQAHVTAERSRGRTIHVTDSNPTWTINHGLGRYPNIVTLNAAKEVVQADVSYTNKNVAVVRHGRAMTGWVLLT